jgi:hypothetical protein
MTAAATEPSVSPACRSEALAAACVSEERWYGRRTSCNASTTAGAAARYPSRPPANANAFDIVRETISREPYSSSSLIALSCEENSA